MFKYFAGMITLTALLTVPLQSYGASPKDLVKEGNTAFLLGEYDKALEAYEEASVDAPESPFIYFNKGTALYKKGDYPSAMDAFEKAALNAGDIGLEAKSKYNMGNCLFRQAEQQMDGDLNKTLKYCEKSVAHYQESLELDPELSEAAENIEVVRLVMKDVLDKINKQEEEAKKQQEAMDQAAEKLKEIIQKQKEAIDRTGGLEKEKQEQGETPNLKEKTGSLAEDQKFLKKQTGKLSETLSETMGNDSSSSGNQVTKHLDNAEKEQAAAAGNLEQYNRPEAMDNQEDALEDLKKALESMTKDQGGQEQQQEQQSQQQQDSRQEQKQASESLAPLSDDAEGILREEKENREERNLRARGTYKGVERDW